MKLVVVLLMGCVSAVLSLPSGKVKPTVTRMNPTAVRVGQSVVGAGPTVARTSFSRTRINPAARVNPSLTIGRPSLARANPSLARGSQTARPTQSLAIGSLSLANARPSLARANQTATRKRPTLAKVRPPKVMSLTPKVARGASAGKNAAQDTDRRVRSPQHYSPHFQVIDYGPIDFNDFPVAGFHKDRFLGGGGGRFDNSGSGFDGPGFGGPGFDHSGNGFDHSDGPGFHSDLNNLIPAETRDKFTPPDPPTKEGRLRKYFGNTDFEVPPYAHAIVHDEPFFDTFDHAKAILHLEKRRKHAHLPTHLLKSLRPYFPFFSETFILH